MRAGSPQVKGVALHNSKACWRLPPVGISCYRHRMESVPYHEVLEPRRDGRSGGRPPVLAAVERWLDAEREQLPLWAVVMFGAGIALWFTFGHRILSVLLLVALAAMCFGVATGLHRRLGTALAISGLMLVLGAGNIAWHATTAAPNSFAKPYVGAVTGQVTNVAALPARQLVRWTMTPMGAEGLPSTIRLNIPADSQSEAVDNNIYIPLSTARSRFGEMLVKRSSGSMSAERVELHRLIVRMTDPNAVISGEQQIQHLLNHFHEKKDFELIVPLQLLREAEATKRMFNIVLGSIAAISLLVGGIGIMNIMLATVTERTREIGVRRALGAKRKDIIVQFLIETIVLSVGGGIIGVLLGILVPLCVSYFTEMKTIITAWSVFLAFGISGLTGIIFGIYPASQAAKLDPIDALRQE